jgi:hypothetical protein
MGHSAGLDAVPLLANKLQRMPLGILYTRLRIGQSIRKFYNVVHKIPNGVLCSFYAYCRPVYRRHEMFHNPHVLYSLKCTFSLCVNIVEKRN